jgi:aminopeptidase N
MDPLGNVVRDFMKETHARNVRNAFSLAVELRKEEGMTDGQVEEMLYASGFEQDEIIDALN